MWSRIGFAAPLVLGLSLTPLCAFCADTKSSDDLNFDAMEARATQAQPREQCFLYAQLVNQMTELSLRQFATGNIEKADGLLRRIQQLTQKIHVSVGTNDKRLKNAEILLSNTAFRLNEMLHASDFDDRSLVEKTLAQVNQAQNDAMLHVFQK